MGIFPEFAEFKKHFTGGKSQLVWRVLPADLDTPVSSMIKLMQESPFHFLFESVEGGKSRARYSIIGLDPDLIWRTVKGKAEINRNVKTAPTRFEKIKDKPLLSLRALIKECQLPIPKQLPPMAAGLFGYMAYDMVRQMERLPDKNPDTIGVPESIYMRPQIIVVFDSVKDTATVITPVWAHKSSKKTSPDAAYLLAQKRITRVIDILQGARPKLRTKKAAKIGPFTSNFDQARYGRVVKKAKEYIAAGDIFQVVPSRRMKGAFTLPPFALYRSLRHLNPSPYLFYMQLGSFTLIGSSPEIMVRLKDDTVTIRPIAGTRPRGKDAAEDLRMERDLLADKKELAEHLMLLDLGRNDVGRVAKPGTVKVTEHMIVERYSHVMHIVSNVEGKVMPKTDAVDALIAGFPAGTVSGAPKIRAMEIIDELEPERRSFYGGTVGYFSASGSMDTCIALRTGLVKDEILYVQAGGGVVADSQPIAEFKETENKAGALISAAERASKFLDS